MSAEAIIFVGGIIGLSIIWWMSSKNEDVKDNSQQEELINKSNVGGRDKKYSVRITGIKDETEIIILAETDNIKHRIRDIRIEIDNEGGILKHYQNIGDINSEKIRLLNNGYRRYKSKNGNYRTNWFC